jgi:hypothetical protein
VYLPQQILSLLLVEIHCRARDGDMNSQVQDQPRQHKETPSQKERKKEKKEVLPHMSVKASLPFTRSVQEKGERDNY